MILHPLDRLPAQFENKFILRIDFFDGIGVSYIAQIRRYRTMVPTVGTVPTVPSAIFKLASYVLVSNELGAASAQCSYCS